MTDEDGYLVGPVDESGARNGLCSRCGRGVLIDPRQLVARVVAAEDGWLTVVCAECAPELFAR